MTLVAGKQYGARLQIRSSAPISYVVFTWLSQDGNDVQLPGYVDAVTAANTWQVVEHPLTGPATNGTYILVVNVGAAPVLTTVSIDNVEVWEYVAPVVGPPPPVNTNWTTQAGLIASASSDFEARGGPYTIVTAGGAVVTSNLVDPAASAPGKPGTRGASIAVTTPGTARWHVRLGGLSMTLAAGKQYGARLQVRTSVITTVVLAWVQQGVDAQLRGLLNQVIAANTWTVLEHPLTGPVANGTYRLCLDMGANPVGNVVYIDNAEVWEFPPPIVGPPPPVNTSWSTQAGLIAGASSNFEAVGAPYMVATAGGATVLANLVDPAASAPGKPGANGVRVSVITPGSARWHIRLSGPQLALAVGRQYGARLQIRASLPVSSLVVAWVLQDPLVDAQLPGLLVAAIPGTTWVTLEHPITGPATNGTYILCVDMGAAAAGAVIYIDNVEVWEVATSTAAAPLRHLAEYSHASKEKKRKKAK